MTEETRREGSRAAAARAAAVFLLLLAATVALQWLGGAYTAEYGSAPDEAAHYVTGLMLRGYLAGGLSGDPLAFAEDYYARFPKVALGHWPPGFYGALAPWMLAFGTSRLAVMVFMALIVAATGLAIYLAGRRALGEAGGLLASLLFVALPLSQASAGVVMVDHPMTLLTFLAVLAMARFLRTGTWAHGLGFGALACLAVLTRGSAWAIGLMPGLAMLLAWRFEMLKRPALWAVAVLVPAVCAPWYVLTRGMSEGSFVGSPLDTGFMAAAAAGFADTIASALGFALAIPAALGVWATIVLPLRQGGRAPAMLWPSLAALVLATYAFHILVPAAITDRYMLAAMPALLLFAAAGLYWIAGRLAAIVPRRAALAALVALTAGAFALESFALRDHRNAGYADALSAIGGRVEGAAPAIVLVVAGPLGEGSAVALAAGRWPADFIVLRGTKLLVEEDWLGRNPRPKVATARALADLLESLEVDAVIVDGSPESRPEIAHAMLVDALAETGRRWAKLGPMPLRRRDELYPAALELFVAARPAAERDARTVDYDRILSLMRRR